MNNLKSKILILQYAFTFDSPNKDTRLDIFIIISLIVIGWLLLYLEIFFIPGVTVLAIIGTVMMIGGIYFSFSDYGTTGGWITVGASSGLMVISLWIGFKSGLWEKISLKESLSESKMNDWAEGSVKVSDAGIAVSRIAPSGTARFNGKNFEVHSQSEFINAQSEIEVVRIENKKIIVQTKK
ncbi:MAG TPA: hypothetical protein DCQ93_04730 [Bacteroidetes bacterium]|nr:hypothetical protein [Bacteroidota bacterium]